MRLSRPTAIAATAAAIAALAAGCGGGSSNGGGSGGGGGDNASAAKDAVTNYVHAIHDQDWSSACNLISAASKKVIETRTHSSCPDALKKGLAGGRGAAIAKLLGSATVQDATVNGTSGTVGIKIPGLSRTLRIPVVKENGGWKVASSSVNG